MTGMKIQKSNKAGDLRPFHFVPAGSAGISLNCFQKILCDLPELHNSVSLEALQFPPAAFAAAAFPFLICISLSR
jgi:hypothetical protein